MKKVIVICFCLFVTNVFAEVTCDPHDVISGGSGSACTHVCVDCSSIGGTTKKRCTFDEYGQCNGTEMYCDFGGFVTSTSGRTLSQLAIFAPVDINFTNNIRNIQNITNE